MNEENNMPVKEEKSHSSETPKKIVKRKKTVSKKISRPKKKTEEEKTPLQIFADKTVKIFDSFIDEIKELPKKTSELSKNSHVVDSISKLIKKTKSEFIQKKDEFTEIHKLNSAIGSAKRNAEEKNILLGRKTFELMSHGKLENSELEPLHHELTSIYKDIKDKENRLKKILEK